MGAMGVHTARHVTARHVAPRRTLAARMADPVLHGYRRALPLASFVAIAAFTCTATLPAGADAFSAIEPSVYEPQAYAAGDFTIPPIQRDAFSIQQFSAVQWPLPTSTKISDGYGYRSCEGCSTFHEGIDFTPGDGYPIQAIADGVVVESENSGALGQHVIIRHDVDGQTVLSIYGHMTADSSTVAVGDTISRGELIGLVGSTGQSTGPHLHFGIQLNGGLVDPYPWMLAQVNL